MNRRAGASEVYHDGEGNVTVIDENGDIMPTDDFTTELDLTDSPSVDPTELDEDEYLGQERHQTEARKQSIGRVAALATEPNPNNSKPTREFDAERIRISKAITDCEAEINKLESDTEYAREESLYGDYNDNSPVEYDPGPLHERVWDLTIKLAALKRELARRNK